MLESYEFKSDCIKSKLDTEISKNKTPRRIALYVIFDQDGILDGYRKYYLQELRKVTDKIVAVVCGSITHESRSELEELTDDFFVRENKGLLTYAWIEGIAHIGWDTLEEYDELLMLNDSFFGPFFPLDKMFEAMEQSDADFYGSIKNFEEKTMKNMNGHPFKHNWLRGSICYFYIIRNKLLHSSEFRNYWDSKPVINENLDTFFFNEFDFYDYVRDAGFKVDAYQSDELNGYCFDNLSHNMSKLVCDESIPFARIRPFGSDMKSQSLQLHYGKDTRQVLEFITSKTDYDENLIWDYILRTKNITDIWNQLQLEYIVSKEIVEKPFTYDKKICVILHIYYKDLVEKMANYCENFSGNTDFYITTTNKQTEAVIRAAFSKRKLNFVCKVRKNVGVAMSTLWVTYADVVTNGKYEYICYFHDKKSPYWGHDIEGEQFGERCYDNLMGSNAVIKNIINIFEDNPRLGMVGPPSTYHGHYFNVAMTTCGRNHENVVDLADKLGIHVNIDPNIVPVAPYGDMFWFRANALKKVIGYGLTYDDFDVKYVPDGTIMHAIERIYGFAVQDSGFYYAVAINKDDARADLVNYQYMINQICALLFCNGNVPYSFDEVKNIIMRFNYGKSVPLRIRIKAKLKQILPNWMWNILKNIYHVFNGVR